MSNTPDPTKEDSRDIDSDVQQHTSSVVGVEIHSSHDTTFTWNVSYKLLEACFIVVCSLGQFALLTHFFGPTDVGTVALAGTFVYIISCLSLSTGIWEVVARGVAQSRNNILLISNGFFLQLLIVISLALTMSAAILSSSYSHESKTILLAAILPTLIDAPLLISEATLAGKEQIGAAAISNIMANLLTFIIFSVGLINDCSLAFLTICLNSTSIICGLYAYWRAPLHRYVQLQAFSREEISFIVRESFPGLIVAAATTIYVRMDILMIEWYLGRDAVAWYSSAYSILDTLMIFSATMMSAFAPSMFKLATKDNETFKQFYFKVVRFLALTFFPIAVAIAIFADSILLYLFGIEYTKAATSLKILMLAAIFAWLNAPAGSLLFAHQKQHLYMYSALLGVAINFTGNILLMPYFGYNGAAISTVLTEIAVCALSLIMITKTIGTLKSESNKGD